MQVDGVEAADDAVVGEGHLGCDVGGGVGGLGGDVRMDVGVELGSGFDRGRTSWENSVVDIRA